MQRGVLPCTYPALRHGFFTQNWVRSVKRRRRGRISTAQLQRTACPPSRYVGFLCRY